MLLKETVRTKESIQKEALLALWEKIFIFFILGLQETNAWSSFTFSSRAQRVNRGRGPSFLFVIIMFQIILLFVKNKTL